MRLHWHHRSVRYMTIYIAEQDIPCGREFSYLEKIWPGVKSNKILFIHVLKINAFDTGVNIESRRKRNHMLLSPYCSPPPWLWVIE